jgi:thioredoxin 2
MSDTRLIRCLSCGALNRVPPAKLEQGLEPVCGKCKKRLSLTSSTAPIAVTDATFAEEVEQSPLPVLLDLWAPWCGPCRMIAPAIEQLAAEMAGRVRVAKLNIDENPCTAERFQVHSIPLLLVLRQGREIDRITGAVPKSEILRRLERVTA